MSGLCDGRSLKHLVDQPSSGFFSYLSGPFFLFDPLSIVGFLIARIFGHLLLGAYMGTRWEIRRYVCMIDELEEQFKMHLYTDFAMAGQVAFSLVACMGTL